MDNGINSKEDIKNFGEVFTPDKIVNDMLDLVSEQLPEDESYITKTFLEPACGDGQFLIRILYRKLLQVQKLPIEQRQLALVKAVSSIYGVDIQEKNVIDSRKRMKALLLGKEITTFGRERNADPNKIDNLDIDIASIEKVIDYILTNNIMIGNTLEENTEAKDENGNKMFIYLTSYEWNDDNSGNLTIAKYPITDIDNEMFRCCEETLHYMDFANKYSGDTIDVGDIAERYKDFPFWNENKTAQESKPLSKSMNKTKGSKSRKPNIQLGRFNL